MNQFKIWCKEQHKSLHKPRHHRLGEDIKQGVGVRVDNWGDVGDASGHVGLHDRNLESQMSCHCVKHFFAQFSSLYLLVKVAFPVGRLHLLVHRAPHQLGLVEKFKLMIIRWPLMAIDDH